MDETLSLHGVTILLVEDHGDSREITQAILTDRGAVVVAAENGVDALKKLATLTPDLILCDLMMPIMDGYTFARRLRADRRYRRLPLVALTAIRDDRAHLRTMIDGFDGHLEKPVTFELMDSLVRFLPRRSPPPPTGPTRDRQGRPHRQRPAA